MDELDAFLDDGPGKRDGIDAFLDGETDALATSGPDEIDAFLDTVNPKLFETTLTPAQEQRFQAWKQIYAPNDSGEDYDLRGAFLSGMTGPDENGHWPDTFKKPNHPTFSNESKYAIGEFARPRAGKWDGDIFLEPGRDKATMGEKVGNAVDKATDAVGNFLAAPVRGAKDTKVFMDAAGWLANDNADRLAESIAAREAARQQRPDYVQQLEDDLKAASDQYSDRPDGVRDTLSAIGQVPGAIIRNPTGAMYTALEQLPNMLPSLAGAGTGAAIGGAAGPAGAVAGAVAGMSAGTIATEAGAKVIELLREQNPMLDLRNPEAVAQALEQPGFREEAARRGLTKGAVIAAVDLLTLGIGGKLATTGTRIFERDLGEALTRAGVDVTDPEAVARALRDPDFMATATPRMRRDGSEVWETPEDLLRPSFESMGARNRRGVATALGVETLGEGFGEGLGELASGGDPTLQDVASEMLGSAGMSAAQVGAGALYEGSKSQLGRGATAAGAAPPEQEFEASTAAVGQAAENARRAAEETLRLLTGPVDAPTAGGRPFDQRLLEDGNARLRAEVPSAELPPAAAPGLDVLRQKRDRDRAILGLGPIQPARPAQPATPPTAGAPSLPAPDTATAAPGTETAVTSEDELGQMFDDVLAEELAADSARDVLVGKLETPDPASTAAEDDAIAKLRAKQRKARERYTKEAQLDPAKDDILTAIAKLGGWSREEAKAQGIDPANFGRRGWRIKRIFTTEGDTADGLAERLSQWGYPVLDENGNYDANRLLDAVSEALAGNKVGSAAYNETQAEVRLQEMQDAQDAFLDGETDDYVPEPPDWIMAEGPPDDGYEPIFEGDAYDGLETPQEEQLFDVARAAIESGMPEDEVEAFIERAAIQGLTNDEIRQAIDEARSERGRVQGGSAPARNQGAEDPAGEAGFQLQDYDAKDLKALTQAEKDRAEAKRLEEQKADADEQRGSFTLTGGERPVDEADARGQTGLFDAKGRAAGSSAPAQLEAWQTEIPAQGLPLTPAQLEGKAGAYSEIPRLLAADAFDAITPVQRANGQRLYAYVLPAAGGRNGIARLFPDDQTPPAPWQLLSGEGVPHGMMTKDRVVEKLRGWLSSAPIIGEAQAEPPGRTPSAGPARAAINWSSPIFTEALNDAEKVRQAESGKKRTADPGTKLAAQLSLDNMMEAQASADTEIVRRVPLDEGMEVRVFRNSRGYGAGLYDTDAEKYVGVGGKASTVTVFEGFGEDSLRKANELADEMVRQAEAPPTIGASIGGELPPSRRPKRGSREPRQPQQPRIAAQERSEGIENFGEALPPARRALAAKLDEDLADNDIANRPLSEIWPLAENEAIEDTFAAAVAHAARDEIPAKPRKSYKLRRWIEQVQTVRKLAATVLDGRLTRERLADDIANGSRASLRDWWSKVQALEVLPRDAWKRIEEVQERPDAYTYVGDQQTPSPMLRVVVDGKAHWLRGDPGIEGKNRGTLAGNLNGLKALLGTETGDKRLQFEARRETSTGRVFVNKKGDPERRALMEFATGKEALEAIKTQYDALVAAWEGVKARDNITERDLRSAENRPRTGRDYRGGRDVTPQDFQQTFGFRGGEFGNWVAQGKGDKQRQALLNDAYDALMDLAKIVGVPPQAISLNGTLGIAFGSRGSGWASAHFEPSNLVINLTKTRGAGALAHEWFHALDNYFSRMRRDGAEAEFAGDNVKYREENFITHRPERLMVPKARGLGQPMSQARLEELRKLYPEAKGFAAANWQPDPNHPEGVRPEVERRFADLVIALDESPMAARARMLDGIKFKGDGYWSRTLERAARAFENFVQARMLEEGYHNDFLVNVLSVEETGKSPDRYPYLMPGEVKSISDAFDALLSEFKTRETERGVALFSMPDENISRTTGIPSDAVHINAFTSDQPLKAHPSYRAAKAGDMKAAARLVADLVPSPEHDFGDAIFVPVQTLEASGPNQIPVALAMRYAKGENVASDIAQVNRSFHTGADPMERLVARAIFDGPVESGARYVLVDDVTTMGGTLADLASFIQSKGGIVVGTVVLTNASRAGTFTAPPTQTRMLERRFGNEIRELFGAEPSALTADEAGYLIGFRNADELRNRVAKAKVERNRRILQKTLGQRPPLASQPIPNEARPRAGLSVSEVEKAIGRAVLAISDAIGLKVRVIATQAELPAEIQADIPPGRRPTGLLAPDGTIYLIAENIPNAKKARITLAHEAIGHVGMNAITRDWQAVRERIQWMVKSRNKRAESIGREVDRRYPGADPDTYAREFIALAAERRVKDGPIGKLLSEIRAMIRRFLTKLGIVEAFPDWQIDVWLSDSASYLRNGRPKPGGDAGRAAFSLSPQAGLGSAASIDKAVEDFLSTNDVRNVEAAYQLLLDDRSHGDEAMSDAARALDPSPDFNVDLRDWLSRVFTLRDAMADELDAYSLKPGASLPQALTKNQMRELLRGAHRGWDPVDVPRVRTSERLTKLVEALANGEIDETTFANSVRLLASEVEAASRAKRQNRAGRERERGPDMVRERLLAGRRRGELDPDLVEFALWALDRNPALADNLAISVRQAPEGDTLAAGNYAVAGEIIRIFKGGWDKDTAVHEILHHAERMMPPAMQNRIRRDWARALARAVKRASPEQREALSNVLPAMAGDPKARAAIRQAFLDGVLDAGEHYQFVNPSEFWAVNASRLLWQRFEARDSIYRRILNWMRELVERVKSLLGARADGNILRALNALLDPARNSGEFLSDDILSAMQSSVESLSGGGSGFDATARAYGGRDAYDRARAAGRTKLTYGQWVQVRTPEFKTWFGDWQALRAQQQIDSMAPVSIRVPQEWRDLDHAALRDRVRESLDAMVKARDTIEHPEIGMIRVGGAGAGKTISEGRDPAKLLIAADLSQALPAAVFSSATASDGQNIVGYAKLVAKVDVGGTELIALFTLRVQADGHWYYNTVAVHDPETQTPAEAGVTTAGPVRVATTGEVEGGPLLTAVREFLRRSLVRVNPDTVSKVIDPGTGEPMVVYRGMMEEIRGGQFVPAKGGTYGAGIYLSKDPGVASFWAGDREADGIENEAGGSVYPVYVAIRNAASEELASEVEGRFGGRSAEELQGRGYDGIIADDGEIVAFRPEQIKSAIGNSGAFSPSDQRIQFMFDDGFDMPSESMFDYLVRNLQDRFRRVKILQRAIVQAGGTVTPESDAYLKEEIFHGKVGASIEAFMRDRVEPLLKAMQAAGVTLEELDDYLYAKHAPERNARIAEIREDMPDGGSGMTDDEATAYIASLTPAQLAKLEPLARRVWAINQARVDLLEQAGLESPEQLAEWRAGYQFYVPLRGFGDARLNESLVSRAARRLGRGFDIRGKESKRALGRRSRSDSPFVYSIAQMQESIVRAAKNEVGQAFLRLVEENPNPSLYTVHTGEWGDYRPAWDARRGEVVYRRDPMQKLGDNVLSVKRDGREHFIVLEDEGALLARAFKNLGVDNSNALVRGLAAYNRYMAAINTSLNPEFVLTNFARDLQTAVINLVGEQDARGALLEPRKMGRKVLKDIPKAMRGAFLGLYDKSPNDPWVRWFNEFRNAGGMINFYSLNDLEGLRAELRRTIDAGRAGAPTRALNALRAIGRHMSNTNSAVENAVRLATYVNARRAGLSRDQSASLARNVTVNFTRKGEYGNVANAAYLFYNAGLQGSVRLLYAISKSNRVRAILAGLAGVAVAWAMLNRFIAGDDDDGENRYDKIPHYIKTRNIIFMRPDGRYWTWPLPYGYNVPWVLGTYAENAIAHPEKKMEAGIVFAQAILESFNPLGGLESEEGFKAAAKLVSPTITDPWVELAINENWMGSPIRRVQGGNELPLPDNQLYWSKGVSAPARELTKYLNELTGGNEVLPGAIDINPETLDHLFSTFTGGLGRTVGSVIDIPMTLANGDELRIDQIPFARRFAGEPDRYYATRRYAEIKEDVQLFSKRHKALLQDADTRGEAGAYREQNRVNRVLEPYVKMAESQIAGFKRQRRTIERSKLDEGTKKLRMERLDTQIEAVRKRVVRRYNEVSAVAAGKPKAPVIELQRDPRALEDKQRYRPGEPRPLETQRKFLESDPRALEIQRRYKAGELSKAEAKRQLQAMQGG